MYSVELPNPGYFTTWSFVLIVIAMVVHCVIPCHTLVAAAVVNSIVVGVAGPAVLAYGDVPGKAKALFMSNLWYHALPMIPCFMFAKSPQSASFQDIVKVLVLFDVLWLLCYHEGQAGWGKIRKLYGVTSPSWIVAIPALQIATLCMLRR